jgi:outer membrane protein TolC
VLRLQAAHERNRAASAVLVALLRLAEAEGGAANLRLRVGEVSQTLEDVRRLQMAGLPAPLTQAEALAQQLELSHKLAELELTIEQLNRQLVQLLGAEPPPGAWLWAAVDLRVIPSVPQADEAQNIALMQRADLAALRRASGASGRESLALAPALLGQANAGLGLGSSRCSLLALLHLRARADETSIRQEQLSAALADQERSVRREVAEALATLETRLTQIRRGGLRGAQGNARRPGRPARFVSRRARVEAGRRKIAGGPRRTGHRLRLHGSYRLLLIRRVIADR